MARIIVLAVIISIITPISVFCSQDIRRFDHMLGTEWFGIYMQGSKIGYASTSIESVNQPVDGWRMDNDLTMIISMMGKIDTTTARDSRIYKSPTSELYSNSLVIESGTGKMTMEGRKESDEYILQINIGGQISRKTFAYPVDYLDSLVSLEEYISSGKAAVGDSLNFATFEPTPPMTGKIHQTAKIISRQEHIFNGVPTEVFTIEWTIIEANISGRNVIDIDGNELEVNLGGGILMKSEPEQQAKTLNATFDILADNLVHQKGKIDDLSKLNTLKLKISGISQDEILSIKSQSVSIASPGTLLVEIKRPDWPEKILGLPIESPRLKPFLEPDPYIQSDDPEITDLARQIVGDEKNSLEAARKINKWVYENIAKQFTPDISNALQTLHTRRGDCGEHSVLAVALMRAAGIPARPVTGLVYYPPGDGFGYHAWIEAFVGDWVMMDPSWGEDRTNPSHIALTTGDLLDQISVLSRVLGKMQIEVVDAR